MRNIISMLLAWVVGITANATIITTIRDVADLQALATSVNAGESYSDVTVTLCDDLDLNDIDWQPIGTSSHPFTGTFDGQNHVLSNLTADGSTSLTAGLFGVVGAGGVVKDVHIASGTIAISSNDDTFDSFLGAIAGQNAGTIVGCSNRALVTGSNYVHARIGGIVGDNESTGSIENCYNLGTVYTSQSNVYIGGLVGYNQGAVRNCWTHCSVQAGGATRAYPLYGNNGGVVTGCFYAGGTSSDALVDEPVVLANAQNNSTTLSDNTDSGKQVLLDNRTLLGNGDWNTLCLPFAIPASGNGRSPIAGAVVKELTSAAINGTCLNLSFTEVTAIEAGKPYLVKWTTGTNIVNPMFLNATISTTTPTATSLYGNKVQFVGTFSRTPLTNNGTQLFLGSGNQIHYPSSSSYNINSCRAYFNVDWTIASGARLNMVIFEGETTGVREVKEVTGVKDDSCYDLLGRKVNGTRSKREGKKGLYIIRSADGQGVRKVLVNK